MKFLQLGLIALVLAPILGHGADYYVATNGVNTNPGSLASPFQTIQQAASVMVAGDRCYVRGGTYRETVMPANSGTAVSPITYQSYSNEVVIISGADPLTGWTNHNGSIWVANMASDWFSRATPGDGSRLFDPNVGNESDLILCDSRLMPLARWPNSAPGCTNLFDLTRPAKSRLTAFISKTNDANNWTIGVFEDSSLPQLGNNGYVGAEILLQPNDQAWSWTLTGYVAASTNRAGGGTTVTLRSPSNSGKDGAGNTYAVNSRYWLWNKLQFLDAPGEWYHDKPAGKLYLWAPDGTNPEGRVEARKRRYAFDLSNRSYITVRGFKLIASTITTDNGSGGDNIGYQHTDGVINTPVAIRYPWRGAGSVASSTNCILEDLDINYPSWYTDASGHFFLQWGQSSGVVLSGNDHLLRRSIIRNSAGNGVTLLGRRNRVQDCLIENVACIPTDMAGVQIGNAALSQDHEIARNTIRYTGRSGITPRGLTNTVPTDAANDWRARIHHNDVSAFGMQDWDTGALYTAGSARWMRIDHNWFHSAYPDVDSRPGNGAYTAGGVYLDFSQDAVIDHNVIWDVEWGIHLQNVNGSSAGNFICYNNTVLVKRTANSIFYGPFGFVENSSATHAGTVISNNLIACSQSLANYKAIDDFPSSAKGKNVSTANGAAGLLSSLGLNLQGGSVYPDALYPTASSTLLVDQANLMGSLTRDGTAVPAYNDPVGGAAPDIGAFEYGLTPWVAGFSGKFPAIVALSNLSQTYNGTARHATSSTTPSGLVVNFTYNGSANAPTNAGSYIVIATVVDNTYQGSTTNTLVVEPRFVAVTADALTKTYGDGDPMFTYQFTPELVGGAGFSGALSRVAGETVGVYFIALGTLALSSNYALSYTGANLTITPRSLTITAVDTNKFYGAALVFAGMEFTASGLLGGDAVSSVTFTSTGAAAGAPVGTHAIIPSAATGSGLGNYSLNYVNGTLTVNPAAPFSITSIAQAGGLITLNFAGASDVTYITESAPNLAGPWSPLSTNTPGIGGIWVVTNSVLAPQQFYRAFIR